MQKPKELRGIDNPNSFTYLSIVKRLPAILQQTLEDNPKLEANIVSELKKIGDDITNPKG